MEEEAILNDNAMSLTHWQAKIAFGRAVVTKVVAQPMWLDRYPRLIEDITSTDLRTNNDTLIPAEIISEMVIDPECENDYYADPDGERLYAVARNRDFEGPSWPETRGYERIPNREALQQYGAYCLFMASDKGTGYKGERDSLRERHET